MNADSIFQIIVTAIVQGITEFLPISSSGHLFFVNELFSWNDINLTLIIAAHLGTLFAVIIYFWQDFKNLLLGIDASLGFSRKIYKISRNSFYFRGGLLKVMF